MFILLTSSVYMNISLQFDIVIVKTVDVLCKFLCIIIWKMYECYIVGLLQFCFATKIVVH